MRRAPADHDQLPGAKAAVEELLDGAVLEPDRDVDVGILADTRHGLREQPGVPACPVTDDPVPPPGGPRVLVAVHDVNGMPRSDACRNANSITGSDSGVPSAPTTTAVLAKRSFGGPADHDRARGVLGHGRADRAEQCAAQDAVTVGAHHDRASRDRSTSTSLRLSGQADVPARPPRDTSPGARSSALSTIPSRSRPRPSTWTRARGRPLELLPVRAQSTARVSVFGAVDGHHDRGARDLSRVHGFSLVGREPGNQRRLPRGADERPCWVGPGVTFLGNEASPGLYAETDQRPRGDGSRVVGHPRGRE